MDHFYKSIPGWSTYEDQGTLIQFLIKYFNSNFLNIAEIGVWKGRCTAMWNVELINSNIEYNYYAIDHFKGSKEHYNPGYFYEETLKNLSPIIHKINLLDSSSIEASIQFKDEYFDIVYIDASHEYEFVKEDIIAWLPKVKKGGIICGDDYIEGWPGVIKAVNEFFPKVNVIGNQQWYVFKN
jgi:predicted O-methyltransferase YrrM